MSKVAGVFYGLQLTVSLILIGCRLTEQMLNDLTLVNTEAGGIAGRMKTIALPDGSQHQIDVFLGIPFAESPTGRRRFMKPVRKSKLGQFFKADIESKACPQNPAILKQWVPGPVDMDEDCLKLNIYVPRDTCHRVNKSVCPKKAVMIWIHGGAFLIGQSRIYNGERLAAVGDVIIVTINYRLGPFGFLTTGDGVTRGNAGLWDQTEAIAWVHEHIAAFGGDTSRITVFGESAGAASAVFQAMFPGNAGKIKRVIASSGTALCPWGFSDESTTKYTLRLAKTLGCVPHGMPGFSVAMHQAMISCLQRKPYEEIIKNSFVGDLNETLFRPEFVPFKDGDFISVLPKDVLSWHTLPSDSTSEHGTMSALSNIDMMIGNNYNDGEAIAKISVRQLLNTVAGVDFDDKSINSTVVNKYYTPQILKDNLVRKQQTDYGNDIMSEIEKVYYYKNMTESGSNTTMSTNSQRDLTLDMILDVTTDYEFLMPTIQTISSIASFKKATSKPTNSSHFLFLFDRKYPFLSTADWVRHASHGDDLPYIFGFPRSMTEAFHITDDIEKAEWNISKMVITYWTNFAKTGNPNVPNQVPTQWKEFDPADLNYLYLTGKMTDRNMRRKLFEDRIHLWRDSLPLLLHI